MSIRNFNQWYFGCLHKVTKVIIIWVHNCPLICFWIVELMYLSHSYTIVYLHALVCTTVPNSKHQSCDMFISITQPMTSSPLLNSSTFELLNYCSTYKLPNSVSKLLALLYRSTSTSSTIALPMNKKEEWCPNLFIQTKSKKKVKIGNCWKN